MIVLETGYQVDVIFTDFSKAFDMVDHGLLINELEVLGIDNCFLPWIRSYLCDRKQFVKIHDVYLDPINITSGVPQDHLSSMMFNMFVNSISKYLFGMNILLYTGDIKMSHRIKALEYCYLLQDEFNLFSD